MNLIENPLHLNDGHVRKGDLEEVNNGFKSAALFYQLLVVPQQNQSHFQDNFNPEAKN